MRQNQILRRLRNNETVYGFWLTSGSPILAEVAVHAGFEWLLLDTQHGYWTYEGIINALQVIGPTETVPVVRVARNDPALIGKLLDAGALGIVVPLVNSPEEAQQAVAAMRYPPEGKRSVGGSRLRLYGDDYFQKANEEILVAVMIERREAAEHAEEILAVPGVDCGFIGPGDLGLSLGTFGRESEEHEAMLLHVLAAGQACDVPVGMPCPDVQQARRRAEQGFRFLTCGSDTAAFIEGMQRRILELRDINQ